MKTMKVKEWIIDKAQQAAGAYNCYIDYERGEDGTAKKENGFVTVYVEAILGETGKAVQVRLRTGDVVGSVKGWKLWIPKSQIAA